MGPALPAEGVGGRGRILEARAGDRQRPEEVRHVSSRTTAVTG